MTEHRGERWPLAALLLLACGVRLAVLWTFGAGLQEDRDAYLAIARQLAERGEFASSPGVPTAYRPPLYPLLLTPIWSPDRAPARGLLHLALSLATLLLLWRIGGMLELPFGARLGAVVLCAFDPVMLRYLAFPMTETLSAFLTTLLIERMISWHDSPSRRTGLTAGIVFGLCVLCRPTFWVFGGLMCVWQAFRLGRQIVGGRSSDGANVKAVSSGAAALGTMSVVLPWLVRNWLVLGTPILMTTHGGYTLLLGNNDAYYREVVEQPWGTVWDGSHGPGQSGWVDALYAEMEAAGVRSEVDQDRWMNRRAWETIRSQPSSFLKACRLRFLSFWSVKPGGEWVGSVPQWLQLLIAGWYSSAWIGFAFGLLSLARLSKHSNPQRDRWGPIVLLVLSLLLVHLFFWTDARMRAPVMPAIALIAVAWVPKGRPPKAAEQDGRR